MRTRFRNRIEAGELLAGQLARYTGRADVVVLALPRGSVPVGRVVADRLGAPLDVLVVRKLGAPGHEELALGAIASDGTEVLNPDIIATFGLGAHEFSRIVAREKKELARREAAFRGQRPPYEVRGRTVVLVDDGVATGATVRAALAALRQQGAGRIVVAAPVIAPETHEVLRELADEVAAVLVPPALSAIGEWYDDFTQTTDAEVVELLAPSGGRLPESLPPTDAGEQNPAILPQSPRSRRRAEV